MNARLSVLFAGTAIAVLVTGGPAPRGQGLGINPFSQYYENVARAAKENNTGLVRSLIGNNGNPNETVRGNVAPTDMPVWPEYNPRVAPLLSLMDRSELTTAFRSAHQCALWTNLNPKGLY